MGSKRMKSLAKIRGDELGQAQIPIVVHGEIIRRTAGIPQVGHGLR